MLTQDQLERERYEARLKGLRDYRTSIQGAHEQGREQGREEGEEKGVIVGRIQTLQQVLKEPITPREELSRLSLDELAALADRLAARLN